jgi:hypothetical protein
MRARLTNDSRVYEVLTKSRRPMTIAEISALLPDIVEKTVRRAVDSLKGNGFVIEAGRDNNAKLYAVAGATTSTSASDKLIPIGNDVVSVEAFVRLLADPKQTPFASRLKTDPLSERFMAILRQRMLFTVLSAGEPGLNAQVTTVHEALAKVADEMQRLTDYVKGFVNSAVWYEHYRDPIALAMRELQKTDPELWKLAWDYVKSGSSQES